MFRLVKKGYARDIKPKRHLPTFGAPMVALGQCKLRELETNIADWCCVQLVPGQGCSLKKPQTNTKNVDWSSRCLDAIPMQG